MQLDGLRMTGRRIDKGFSGGAVYSAAEDAVVGMIAESDIDATSRVAQFIDASKMLTVMGIAKDQPTFVQTQAAKHEIVDLAMPVKPVATHNDSELLAFVGRMHEEEQFTNRLSQGKSHMHFVGHGGIGKSLLLKKLASLAEGQHIGSAYIDLGFAQSPLDLVRKLVFALLSTGSCEFPRYLECINKYAVIENNLLRQPNLKHQTIYYLSKLQELVPTIASDRSPGQASPDLSTEPFSSNDSFAVHEALSRKDREFFVNPLHAMVDAFTEDVKSERLVFEFDRTERVSQPLGEWLMRSFLPRFDQLVTVSAGRDDISHTWGSGAVTLRVFELGPLSGEESQDLLMNVGVLDQRLRRKIATTSQGIPLALVLAGEVAGSLDDEALGTNVDSWVVDRMINVFLEGIPDTRRQALQRLCIFRRFNRETVLDLAICDPSTIDAMLKVRFIKHVPYGYAIHDRVRDFLLRDLRRQQPKSYQQFHEVAAEYYYERMGPYTDGNPDFLEWLYHQLSARPNEAFEHVRREFTRAALAIKPDFCEGLIGIASESNTDGALPKLWLRFFEGSIRRQLFDFKGANEIYEEILRDPDIEHLDELKAELLYQRSVVLWYLCRFEEARELAQKGVDLNRSLGKTYFENRSLGIVGLSFFSMGQFAPATSAVQRMARQSGDGDPVSRAYALNSVGNFSWHSGHWRRSERAFEESLEVWKSLKNPVGQCYPLCHLGLLYSSTNRHAMALEMLERAERMCRLTGNLEMLAKTLQCMCYHYRRMGRFEQAVKFGQESLEICERMKSPYYVADSMRLLSEAYLELGNSAAAKQAAVVGLERLLGPMAVYLHLRLKVAFTLARVECIVVGGENDISAENEVSQDLGVLISSALVGGFDNLAAGGVLGRLKLAAFRKSSQTLKCFETGANYAFSYNWYAGMDYLERSKRVLLATESLGEMEDSVITMFDESRLRQLYNASNSQALRRAREIDDRRLTAFAQVI